MNDLIREHREVLERLRREMVTSRELNRALRNEMSRLRAEVHRFRLHT